MIEPTSALGGDAIGLPPLFFRKADRMRLEGCVAGLLRDGRSLALSSTHEAALDHYSRLLISRLREIAPQSPPELYFPADTAAMISRFNDSVAALSVQEAMQAGPLPEPSRIWVVHDAGALASHEMQLLARLVQNFPGANIRVVFLLGASNSSRAMFDAMDRRFLRWDIEAPTPEQAQAMLVQGREDGCEGVVRSLLKKLEAPTLGAPAAADPAGIDPLGFQAGATAKTGPLLAGTAADVFKFSADDESAKNETPKSGAKAVGAANRRSGGQVRPSLALRLRALLSWILIFLALVSLSVGVTAWLHPTVFTLDRLEMAKRWAMDFAAPAASALAPGYGASAALSAPSTPPAVSSDLPQAASPATSEAASGLAAVEAVVKPAELAVSVAGAPLVSSSAASAPGVAIGANSAVQEAAEVEPPAEALAGQAWIQPMPVGTWVVQHAAMPTYQAAKKWQQDIAPLADARIVALYRPSDKLAYFAVVSGPFTSRTQATTFAARKGLPADAWVRSARSLKDQFSPASSPAATAPKAEASPTAQAPKASIAQTSATSQEPRR